MIHIFNFQIACIRLYCTCVCPFCVVVRFSLLNSQNRGIVYPTEVTFVNPTKRLLWWYWYQGGRSLTYLCIFVFSQWQDGHHMPCQWHPGADGWCTWHLQRSLWKRAGCLPNPDQVWKAPVVGSNWENSIPHLGRCCQGIPGEGRQLSGSSCYLCKMASQQERALERGTTTSQQKTNKNMMPSKKNPLKNGRFNGKEPLKQGQMKRKDPLKEG